MAELATREFISQWAYDHEQDRNDARDEAAMQCIGADRVAELLRQRHEHRLDRNFDVMDFETRAAAIDVHFLQAPRCRSPESGRKSPQPVRPSRVRPQSASLARRCGDNSSSRNEISARQRPQSAKYRSELARRDPNVGHVDWNAHAQEKPSKWREMLVYGPEFKQLTLRKLELETYELLYKTLDRQEIDVKPTRRRRKRANTDNTAKPNDYSTAPACGSGLHLARSRKNRQQEHDRRMMLGRGRQNSRRGEQEKPKGGGQDKQAIQDKTRRRNKLLIKKKSQRQLRECQPDDRTAKREKHPEEPCLQRQASAQRTNRMPWMPSGSLNSLAIRGISSETSGLPVTQERRLAEVLDAFQSHAKTHLRLSKHIQKQLQRVQQCAKTAVARESRKTDQTVKHYSKREYAVEYGHSASASIATDRASNESINPGNYVSRGNQEDDQVGIVHEYISSAPLFVESQPPANEDEPLPRESPATPRLVIPPLKLPPNLWEYQLTGDSLDEDLELCQGESKGALKDACAIALPVVVPDEATFSKMKFENPPANSSARDEPAISPEALRRPTVEDIYLAEGNLEQASAGSATDKSESPLVARQQELQQKGMTRLHCCQDDDCGRSELANQGMDAAADPLGDVGIHTPRSKPGAESVLMSSNTKELLYQVMKTAKQVNPRTVVMGEATPCPAEQEAFIDTVEKATPSRVSPRHGTPAKNAGVLERPLIVGNSTGHDFAERCSAADSAGEVPRLRIGGELELTGVGAGGKHKDSGDTYSDTTVIVYEEDAKLSLQVVLEYPKLNDDNLRVVPDSSNANSSDVRSCNLSSDQLLNNHIDDDQDQDGWFRTGEKHDRPTLTNNTVELPLVELEPALLDQPPSIEADEFALLTSGSVSIKGGNDIVQTVITKTAANFDPNEAIQHHASVRGDGERDANDRTTVLSSPPPLTESPVIDFLNVVPTTQSTIITTPSTAADMEPPALEVKSDLTTEGGRSAVKKVSRSPKRKPKKTKSPVTEKSTSPKKSRQVASSKNHQWTSSQPSATDAPTSLVSQSEASSPEVHSEEDPLRLHQQEATRSFLKRISSRKVVEPEPVSIQTGFQPQSSKEPVGNGDELGSAEAVAAKTVLAVMDVEGSNVKPVKERKYHDGVSPLERDHPSDYESAVEKYPHAEIYVCSPATTADVATTPSTEKLSMTITGFTSAVDDGSTSLPTVMAKNTKVLKDSVVDAPERDDESPVLPSDDRHYAPQQEWENSTDATDTNHTNQAIDQDFTQQLIPERQHPAARKIQDQYRCFVRRRIILDQLRFIVAKQRREVRRKSRVKPKKTKDVILDTIAMVPVSEHECRAVETEVTHVDSVNGGLSEHDKQVAQISIKKEIPVGIGMPLAAPLSEDGDSSKEDVLFAARKDSSEYVFDVFDGSNQENGGIQEGATGHVEEVVDKVSAMSTPYLTSECTTSAENLVDQQKRYAALSEKDVSAVNIANATCSCVSCEPLQREEGVLDEQPVLASSGLGVETSTQQPVGVSQISSMLLAELAFADDVEEDKSVAVAALEDPPPHWERYMDSATNKSFYYNPATSETQWTNPEAHAGVNSIDTPTTSHVTVATTDVNGNNKSKASSGLWQEFLDETSGQLYYYNTQTGECSWEVPAAGSDAAEVVVSPQSGATAETAALGASPWIMYIDPASQAPYYVNVETLATTWEQPEDFAVAASESATVVTTEVAGVIEDAYVIAVDDHTGVEI